VVIPAKVSGALAGSLIMLTPALAANAPEAPQVLAPSSPWNLDYGVESCTLSRNFGEGDAAMSLYLKQTHPGIFFDLSVAGRTLGKARPASGTTLRFAEEPERKFKDNAWVAEAADGRPVLLLGGNSFATWDAQSKSYLPAPFERLKSLDRLAFSVPQARPFTLTTGPMDKPMAALQACEDDLVRTWGFDPAQLASLSRQPEPLSKPDTWISPDSYPERPLRSGEGAILNFRIIVAPTGRAESCVIQSTVGDKVFADSACRQLMANARFTPALDAAGQPVRALWFNSALYQSRGDFRPN
jgi:hypothetical protein